MCGIAGIVNGAATGLVAPMLDVLAHRGPDGRGLWHDENFWFIRILRTSRGAERERNDLRSVDMRVPIWSC